MAIIIRFINIGDIIIKVLAIDKEAKMDIIKVSIATKNNKAIAIIIIIILEMLQEQNLI